MDAPVEDSYLRSPRSPWPEGILRLADVRLSRDMDRSASTTFSKDVPRAFRRTKSLLGAGSVRVWTPSGSPASFSLQSFYEQT